MAGDRKKADPELMTGSRLAEASILAQLFLYFLKGLGRDEVPWSNREKTAN
jgi:hypothetical protein